MSLGILNLQGGNIEQHMTGNIVTANEKNMENWNAVGEVSIGYTGGVNTLTYENNPKTPAQVLKEGLEEASGLPVTDSCITSLLSFWEQHQTLVLFYFQENNLGAHCWFGTQNDYIDTDGFHFNAGGYDLIMSNPGNTSITGIAQTNAVTNTGVFPISATIKMARVCAYDDLSHGGGFEGYIDKNFNVENGKKYIVMFVCYSPSGFNANSNNVVITSGANTSSITIDNENTTDYAQYYQYISAYGTTLNVKFDLETIANSVTDVELKIGSIEIYELNA